MQSRALKNGTYYMVITIPEIFWECKSYLLWCKKPRKWNWNMKQIRQLHCFQMLKCCCKNPWREVTSPGNRNLYADSFWPDYRVGSRYTGGCRWFKELEGRTWRFWQEIKPLQTIWKSWPGQHTRACYSTLRMGKYSEARSEKNIRTVWRR